MEHKHIYKFYFNIMSYALGGVRVALTNVMHDHTHKAYILELRLAMFHVYKVGKATKISNGHKPYTGEYMQVVNEFLRLCDVIKSHHIDYENFIYEDYPIESLHTLVVEFLHTFGDRLREATYMHEKCNDCNLNMYIYSEPCSANGSSTNTDTK